jgi:hypothetical protein
MNLIAAIDNTEDKTLTQKEIAILDESGQLTPKEGAELGVRVIQASALKDLRYVVSLFDLQYHDDESHVWEEPEGPDAQLSNDICLLI